MRRSGRVTVTLKLATSIDGAIATAGGESQWITGTEARRRVHLMRAQADAILTGGGTVLADDPSLDVRLPGMAGVSPVPVIADRRLRTPTGARVLARGDAIVLGDRDANPERAAALEAAGATVVQMTGDVPALLDAVAALGYASVFCEGGATLAAALMREDCVDRLVWFTGGAILGGDARRALDALGIDRLADAPRFGQVSCETIGSDTVSLWQRDAGAR
jgi:diaminohydroxyphosphoribosylaminopyrimidine deaminase/5-amino-6-(5-phosphoribosylamino)uracil reductase